MSDSYDDYEYRCAQAEAARERFYESRAEKRFYAALDKARRAQSWREAVSHICRALEQVRDEFEMEDY